MIIRPVQGRESSEKKRFEIVSNSSSKRPRSKEKNSTNFPESVMHIGVIYIYLIETNFMTIKNHLKLFF